MIHLVVPKSLLSEEGEEPYLQGDKKVVGYLREISVLSTLGHALELIHTQKSLIQELMSKCYRNITRL